MRLRILFISSRPLFPVLGGDQIRTVQQLNLLNERFDVDILYITPDDKDCVPSEFKYKIGSIFRFQIGSIKCIFQTLRFIFNSLPLQVNYYYNSKIAKKIDSIISNYDCVFCNNIRTAEYVRNKTGIIKYLDFVDAISMNYDKARHEAKGLKKLIYEIDYRRCGAYEQKCLESFDSCAVISDIDNRYISSWKK